MYRLMKTSLKVYMVLCLMSLGSMSVLAQVFDTAVDFDKDHNPATVKLFQGVPVWSYGWRIADDLLTTKFQLDPYPGLGFNLPGMFAWSGQSSVCINKTGADFSISGALFKNNRTWGHPGPNGEYAVFRWTAPASGLINIAAEFVCRNPNQSGDGVDAHVLINGTALWNMLMHYPDDKSFTINTFSVNGGDVIDFALGAGSTRDYSSDHTEVNASVVFTPGPVIAVSSISVTPASNTGGRIGTGTVALTKVTPGGQTVRISTNNSAMSAPSFVLVPAGSNKATFVVHTSPVAVSTSVSVSATAAGVTKSKTVTLIPPVVVSLTVSPDSIAAGDSTFGVVILNAPAPAGGLKILLSSNNGAATVAADFTIPAGAVSGTFSVGSNSVSVATTATISATAVGSTVTKTDTLTVQPF